MGNLPTSRTITLATGDALPSNLVNEIQDVFVGDKRAAFKPAAFASGWISTGTLPTLVANPQAGGLAVPVWKLPTGATHRASLLYQVGELFSDVEFDIFGDGTADWTLNMSHATDLTAAPATSLTIASGAATNSPASWTRYTMSVIGAAAPTVLQLGYLQLEVVVAGGGAQIYLGNMFMGMSRP